LTESKVFFSLSLSLSFLCKEIQGNWWRSHMFWMRDKVTCFIIFFFVLRNMVSIILIQSIDLKVQ
jgi:hypothetical protein